MKKYEIREANAEVFYKEKKELYEGNAQEYNIRKTCNGDTELIAAFDTVEEAKEELKKYKTRISYEPYHKIYLFREYFIEENEYDTDGEWIGGGTIWEYSEFPTEWESE